MSRPAQLEQQVERVKQIQEEMLNQQELTDDNNPPAPQEPVPNPQNPEPVPHNTQEPATITKEEYDRLEQRYRTLQGMHRADTNELRVQLNGAIAALENLRAEAAAKQHTPPAGPSKYVTDDDVEDYGDTLEMVRRAAREEAEAVAFQREQALVNRIAQLEAEAGHVRKTVMPAVENMAYSHAEQERNNFWNTINTQVPDWESINATQGFIDWLQSEDKLTGMNRQHFLSQAQANYDAQRVVNFFNEWKRTAAGGQTPAPTNNQAHLQQYVAPGTSRKVTPVEPKKKEWTGDEIGKFYQDALMGKYRDKPEEKKRIEAEIFAYQTGQPR